VCCCVTLLLLHKHAPAEPAEDPTAPSIASIPEDDGVNSTAGEKVLVALQWLNEHTFLTFVPSCRNQRRHLLSTTTRPTNSRPVPTRARHPGRQNNVSHPHHNQLRVRGCRRWSSYRLHLRNLRSSLFHTPSVSTCIVPDSLYRALRLAQAPLVNNAICAPRHQPRLPGKIAVSHHSIHFSDLEHFYLLNHSA
jgi:hypothetical protein